MRMTVITNESGQVMGTHRHEQGEPRRGQPRFSILAGPGQTKHEIELPAELEGIGSAEELHKRLEEYLRRRAK
jgi:hypothetical protein